MGMIKKLDNRIKKLNDKIIPVRAKEFLLPALRQYQHNDCSGLFFGYDYEEVNKIVGDLLKELDQIKRDTKIKTYKGWVIDSRSEEGHGLIGKYWWFDEKPPTIPFHLSGHKTAVFRTRKKARECLSNVRKAFPKAKVERVTIDINVQRS